MKSFTQKTFRCGRIYVSFIGDQYGRHQTKKFPVLSYMDKVKNNRALDLDEFKQEMAYLNAFKNENYVALDRAVYWVERQFIPFKRFLLFDHNKVKYAPLMDVTLYLLNYYGTDMQTVSDICYAYINSCLNNKRKFLDILSGKKTHENDYINLIVLAISHCRNGPYRSIKQINKANSVIRSLQNFKVYDFYKKIRDFNRDPTMYPFSLATEFQCLSTL